MKKWESDLFMDRDWILLQKWIYFMPGIHYQAMWLLSFGQLFGWSQRVCFWVVLTESPALGILFLIWSRRAFCWYPLYGWTNDSWHTHLLALMIVLITCWNGITGNSLVYRWDFCFGNRVIHSLINATLILVSICCSDAHLRWRRNYVIREGARQMEEANYWNWRLSQWRWSGESRESWLCGNYVEAGTKVD